MFTTFPPFYCGSSAILVIAWVGCLGYIPILDFRSHTENAFFWPRGVPNQTFPPIFLPFYDGNYDATTTTTTAVLMPERDHQAELSTLMLTTIVGTNNHWHSREMSYFYCWTQNAMSNIADCPRLITDSWCPIHSECHPSRAFLI